VSHEDVEALMLVAALILFVCAWAWLWYGFGKEDGFKRGWVAGIDYEREGRKK